MDSRTPLFPMSWLGSWLVAAALVVLSGCAMFDRTPEEVRAVDEEVDPAHRRILAADAQAIDTLLAAYLIHERHAIDDNLDADMRDPDNMEAVEVLTLPEPGEDGRIDPADIERSIRHLLEPDMAASLARDHLDAMDRAQAMHDVFREAWRVSREGNEADYQRFREFLRDWRDRPAFGPDQIRGMFRGLESELPTLGGR